LDRFKVVVSENAIHSFFYPNVTMSHCPLHAHGQCFSANANKADRFEASSYEGKPHGVEVYGPGFLWSWNYLGLSYLTALVKSGDNSISKKSL
jgi:hypothetical protein